MSEETTTIESAEIIYLSVPFQEKDEAKALGAFWDADEKRWFVPEHLDASIFSKWLPEDEAPSKSTSTVIPKTERIYLAVPYSEREIAKNAGAFWDTDKKSWYVGEAPNMDILKQWLYKNLKSQKHPVSIVSIQSEFSDALRTMGCVVAGGHPFMDGKPHRIKTEGDKPGKTSGFYVLYPDNIPAGFIKNHRTGEEMKWRSKAGNAIDDEARAKLKADAARKSAERKKAIQRQHDETAARLRENIETLQPVTTPTGYMQAKGIEVHTGSLTDEEGETLCLPAIDITGKVWSMQYVFENGTKLFEKDSRKESCFHVLGSLEDLQAANVIVIAEGYATAASIAEAIGQVTIAAFDAGNLLPVAKALREAFPEKPIVIAGDDDRALALMQGINIGRQKALAAAGAVGGQAIFPRFSEGEAEYPATLESVTPNSYREHLRATNALEGEEALSEEALSEEEIESLKTATLSIEQLDALDAMKRYTDFNDLVTRSARGVEAGKAQIREAVCYEFNRIGEI